MSWESALQLVDSISEKCDSLIDAAEETDNAAMDEFATSVQEKAESIGNTIEARCAVTERQLTALRNMETGVDNWLDRQRK